MWNIYQVFIKMFDGGRVLYGTVHSRPDDTRIDTINRAAAKFDQDPKYIVLELIDF